MHSGIVACILISLSGLSQAHDGVTCIIKDRIDRFKENKEAMKAIKRNLTKDTAIIAQKAFEVETWANEMVEFFPGG
ncbi:MAG TPA: hypothetical protein DEF72_04075 [Gammaproteobacteria bacterium]|nr:hypothetical protein [Gammaproteobacteria bacterium]